MNDKILLLGATGNEDEVSLSDDLDIGNVSMEEEEVTVDEYVRRVGECGRYQILINVLISLFTLPMGFQIMLFYYIGHSPSWKCNPSDDFTCPDNITIHEHSDTTRCSMNRSHWKYEALGKSTIVTEFDLVCSRSWLDSLTGSIVFIGWGIGIIIMGYLSDQFGRKRVMYPCLLLSLTCLLLHGFVTGIWMLIVLRFVMGFLYSAPALNSYVMIMELVGPSYRVLATTLNSVYWPLGALLLTLKAYYLNSWRTLCIVCSAPYLVGFATILCVPESVRWLNMKGRKKQAEAILERAARMNKKHLPPLSLRQPEASETNVRKASYIDLFRTCAIAKLVLAQSFMWFNNGMTYYAINWEFADFGNMYASFILSFVIELPGGFVTWFLMQKCGRKKTTTGLACLTALSCLAVAFTPVTSSWKHLRLAFGLLGKFAASCVFSCSYMWSSEIYATTVRSQGMGINIVTSRIGAAISTFVNQLSKFHPGGPFILMGFTSLIAAALTLILPETLNKPTRETLNDMTSTTQYVEMRSVFVAENNNNEFTTDDLNTSRGDALDFGRSTLEFSEENEEDVLIRPTSGMLDSNVS